MASSNQDNASQHAQSIPPEFAERMRQRRPGYDQIYELVCRYDELSTDDRARMSAEEVEKAFIAPMFQALGWEVWEPGTLSQREATQIYVELAYQELRVPVEIKKFNDPLASYAVKGTPRWQILTNFELVLIWDIESFDRPEIILKTSPDLYVVDGDEKHDLLAAEVFYERLAQPPPAETKLPDLAPIEEPEASNKPAEFLKQSDTLRPPLPPSPASNPIGLTGELNIRKIPRGGFDAPVGSDKERAEEVIWPASWVEVLSFLSPLPDAPNSFSPGVRLVPRQTVPATHPVYAPSNGNIVFAEQADEGWYGTIIIESVLPDQTYVFSRISQLSDITVKQDVEVARGQLIGHIDFSQPDQYLRYEISKSDILLTESFHWAVDNPQVIKEHYLDPTEFTRANHPRPAVQNDVLPLFENASDLDNRPIDIAIRALADQPSEVDLLGFKDYAQALSDFIKSERTEKPLVIGINAAWGMGKTTLMRMIRQELVEPGQKEKRGNAFPTVWFNAWKYDEEESLWAALVLEILGQVRRQFGIWKRLKLWLSLNRSRFDWGLLLRSIVKSLAQFLAIFLLGALVFIIVLPWLGITFQESAQKMWQYFTIAGTWGSAIAIIYGAGKEAYERLAGSFDLNISRYIRQPDYQERIGFMAQFEADFKRVIAAVTNNGKWPLVVFIDDLDRCAPPKPVEIIEAINLLLDSKHCVFILGMDAQTVASSIEAKYKDLTEILRETDTSAGLSLGQRFLEKIIQINFRIPRVDSGMMVSFIEANLALKTDQPAQTPIEQKIGEAENLIKAEQRAGISSVEAAAQVVQRARPDLAEEILTAAKQEVQSKSFDDAEEVKNAIREAVPYLGFNPRKIKRFINMLRLQALIANRRGLLEGQVIQLDLLAKWLIIATCWPELVETLIANQEFADRLQQACALQEKLQQLEAGDLTIADEAPEKSKTGLQADLENLLSDAQVKLFLQEHDLMKLLQAITKSGTGALLYYLHLAQSTIEQPGRTAKLPGGNGTVTP